MCEWATTGMIDSRHKRRDAVSEKRTVVLSALFLSLSLSGFNSRGWSSRDAGLLPRSGWAVLTHAHSKRTDRLE
jgi:hypothetical protein